MSVEGTFDIKDTWFFVGLLAQREEAEVTRYIQEKKSRATLSSKDIADIEYASEIRGTLREVKQNCGRMAHQEKGGQYSCEALEKLLKWHVISEREMQVMILRESCTYREIGIKLSIDPQTAFRTVQRVHERVKLLYKRISHVDLNGEFLDEARLLKNAEKVADKIVSAQLSPQQLEIYKLMCKGMSNQEIALRLGTSVGNVKKQKSIVNRQKALLNM